MTIKLTINSYRSFAPTNPAVILIDDGYTALTGPNNSGKSNILRFFYEMRGIFGQLASESSINTYVKDGVSTSFSNVRFQNDPFNRHTDDSIDFMIEIVGDDSLDRRAVSKIIISQDRASEQYRATLRLRNGNVLESSTGLVRGHDNQIGISNNGIFHSLTPLASAFAKMANTIYAGPSRSIMISGGGTEYDIQIGSTFIARWASLKTGESEGRGTARRVENLIGSLLDRPKFTITADPGNTSLVIDDGTATFHIDELGTGLTQLIIVLINVALSKPSFVLIDEPEAHLHARLQLSFLTAIAQYAQIGVIYTTHNYGLARTVAHNAYSVTMNKHNQSIVKPLVDRHKLSELLGSLNYAGFQEVGFDAVLMVEGVNDIFIVQEFLRKMNRGGNVVILPLGGDNSFGANAERALTEIARISEQTYIMIDSDRSSESEKLTVKKTKFVNAAKQAGIKECHVLNWREIENYLPSRSVESVTKSRFSGLQPFSDVPSDWPKNLGGRIAAEATNSELEGTDLWEFLERISRPTNSE